mmetsp:Transcript_21738/g.64009  ORF Transcript_21738/g.64009 Transcript_21738/m.64009 type:complete len:275 (+) Transcript_21738:1542-2366(+)
MTGRVPDRRDASPFRAPYGRHGRYFPPLLSLADRSVLAQACDAVLTVLPLAMAFGIWGWCQERDEVVVSVEFDPSIVSARDVRATATGALPYADGACAVGSGAGTDANAEERSFGSLVVSARSSSKKEKGGDDDDFDSPLLLLKGELPHAIHLAEDEDEVEWEIETLSPSSSSGGSGGGGGAGTTTGTGGKFVRVTLRKVVPMPGVCIWWDSPFNNCPKIDVETIEARKRGTNTAGDNGGKSKQEQVKEAWDEAHRMFREKVKSRKAGSTSLAD